MCGICGFNWEDKALIRKCAETIRHRGPDADGFYTSQGISFGQRRLAVIDTTVKGNQPMSNEEGDLWINYNGETYNYAELKAALKNKHSFVSQTDTEVILHLYEEQGPEMLNLLNGMFAIAIWDDRKKELFIARDRFGIKPLYYYWDGKRFIFASEIKSILVAGVRREVNRDALNNYLTYKFSPGPKTLFKGISKLQPGHYLKLRGEELEIRKWYDLDYTPLPESKSYFVEHIRRVLDDYVRRTLIADVHLGAFLSGGIDSSAVVATMARLSKRPVKTFSVGFTEKGYDELEHAKKVAEAFGLDHPEIVMEYGDIEKLLPRITWHLDEPFGDFASIPTHMVSEFTRKKVTVALSGDGGDESFVGYRQSLVQHYGRSFGKIPAFARRAALSLGGMTFRRSSHQMKALKNLSIKSDAERSLSWNRFMDDEFKREVVSGEQEKHIGSEREMLDPYNPSVKGYPELHKNLYTEFKTWLPDDSLFKVDKMTMMNSLEARVPLLDHELVELAASVPYSYKMQGMETKHLLKLAVKDRLPPEVLHRRKHGFNVPTAEWYRGELKDYLKQTVLDESLKPYLDMRKTEKLLDKHISGRENYHFQLNTLLSFGLWHKVFIEDWRTI